MPGREGFTWAAGGGTPTWKRRRGCAEPIRLPPMAPPPAAPAGHRHIKASGWPGASSSATGTARRGSLGRGHSAPPVPPQPRTLRRGGSPPGEGPRQGTAGKSLSHRVPSAGTRGLFSFGKAMAWFFHEKMPFFPIYGQTLHEKWCFETRRFLLASTSPPQGRKREGSKIKRRKKKK